MKIHRNLRGCWQEAKVSTVKHVPDIPKNALTHDFPQPHSISLKNPDLPRISPYFHIFSLDVATVFPIFCHDFHGEIPGEIPR
jgi:hypothetical protein